MSQTTAAEGNDVWNPEMEQQKQQQSQQQQQQAQAGRWSHHLANNPWGAYGDQYAKQWYNDPNNADPGASMRAHLQSYRSQWGDAAPEDDASLMQMIASGQNPVATSQFPVQPYPSQLNTVQTTPRNDELYNILLGRAKQSLNVDRNDPIIRAQADAYSANEERARRNYISDTAERRGPYANLQGERRMAAERVGQRTGAFEASLVARELQSRRDEISQTLEAMRGMLTVDQQLALQRELGLLDAALRQQSMQNQTNLQQGALDLDRARLGLEAEQQATYWDWIKQGGTF